MTMRCNLVYSREEFSSYYLDIGEDIIFIPEVIFDTKASHFVKINPTPESIFEWIRENCEGRVLCFAASDDFEWWGFSNPDDVFLFLIRWQ